jgi:hypothetical protein
MTELPGDTLAVELNEWIWSRCKADIEDVTPEEADWRPVPQANSINIIVRHLRIEAGWHVASLERGEPMPADVTPALQQEVDAVPLDFRRNLKELDELYTRFNAALRRTSLADLQQRTAAAYEGWPNAHSRPAHLLGFHQAAHLAMHFGQIRTIRTLYIKARGEPVPARYFPGNVSYPKSG